MVQNGAEPGLSSGTISGTVGAMWHFDEMQSQLGSATAAKDRGGTRKPRDITRNADQIYPKADIFRDLFPVMRKFASCQTLEDIQVQNCLMASI